MDRETSQGLGPFLVLSDSTLQYMLRENSYGAYPLFEGYVLSCPGAALNISTKAVPSILELLHWQFGLLKGFRAAYQSQEVANMPQAHLESRHAAKPPVYSAVKEPPARTTEKL